MVTFAEARQLVAERYADTWPVCDGTFYVAPAGWEDETHWLVVCGAAEWLRDGDAAVMEWDAPAVLVAKETGVITELVVIEDRGKLAGMEPTFSVRPP